MTNVLPRLANRQTKILLLLIGLTFIRGLIYATFTPLWWQGHDEEFHFAHIKLLADRWSGNDPNSEPNWPQEMVASFTAFPNGRWSQWPEQTPDLTTIPDRYTNFTRASPAYYPYAWLDRLLVYQDLLFQLFALRLVSVLITCTTIIFTFLTARHIFADSPLAQVLTPWLIFYTPAFMITGSTVSDANLAILLATVVFYLLILEIREHRVWYVPLALGLTLLALWAKATTFFLLPVWGLLVGGYIWQQGRQRWLWLSLLGGGTVVAFYFLPGRIQEWLNIILNIIKQTGITTAGLAYVFSSAFFWYTFSFFWIILGWSVYLLPQPWYVMLLVFVLLAIVGLGLYGWRHFRKKGFVLGAEQKSLLLALLFAVISIAILMGIGIIRYEERDGRSARYIFPAIVPLAILMVAGWRELLPAAWRKVGFVGLAGAFFLFDTLVWIMYAIPWYYPFWPH